MTFLLVDDEETDRAAVRQILEAEGYTVIDAENCEGASHTFRAHRDEIDLLIADIALPDGNGCDLAISLWKEKPSLRALFVSGHVGAEVCRYYGLDVKNIHFLRKPYPAEDLRSRVRQVLTAEQGFPKLYSPKARTSAAEGRPAEDPARR